jgi:hypothetical protein
MICVAEENIFACECNKKEGREALNIDAKNISHDKLHFFSFSRSNLEILGLASLDMAQSPNFVFCWKIVKTNRKVFNKKDKLKLFFIFNSTSIV